MQNKCAMRMYGPQATVQNNGNRCLVYNLSTLWYCDNRKK